MKKLFTLAVMLCVAATIQAQETVSFTVFAGDNYGNNEGCQKVMDNDLSTKWGYYGSDMDHWVYFKTTDGSKIFLTGYAIVTANDNSTYGRLPKEWEIFGSNDENIETSETPENCEWTSINYLRGDNVLQKQDFTAYYYSLNPGLTSYKYFRMKIVYGSGDDQDANKARSFQISEFIPSYMIDKSPVYNAYSGEEGFNDNESYAKAVDGDKDTKWGKQGQTGNLVFGTSSSISVKGYTFTTGGDAKGRDPKTWKLYGMQATSTPSANDQGWEEIDSKTNQSMPNGRKTDCHYLVNNPTSNKYNYFKLEITESRDGSQMQFSEFKIDDDLEKVALFGTDIIGEWGDKYPKNLFDGSSETMSGTKWNGAWYVFGDATEAPRSITGYAIQSQSWMEQLYVCNPSSWELYGSNDSKTNDGSWTLIHRVENDTKLPQSTRGMAYYYLDEPSAPYKYFKWVIKGVVGETESNVIVSEFTPFFTRDDQMNWLELRDNTNPVFNGNVKVNDFHYTFSNDKKWGMICTPFALTGNDNISFYTPSKETSQWLEFSNASTVAANTPALFNKPAAGNITFDGTNVELIARPSAISTTVGNWTMTGTKIPSTATNNFIIAGNDANEVHLSRSASSEVKPFRAYLTNSSLSEDAAYFVYDDLSKTIVVVEKENKTALVSALSIAKAAANRSDALSALRTARKVANIETDNATYAGNEPVEGEFYIFNVGRKAYLTGGSDWGTHAALGYPGLLATLASNGSGYTVQFNELIQGDARDKYLNGSPYVDGENANKTIYTFEAVGGKPGVYYIKDGEKYLAFDPNGEVDGGGIKHYNSVTKWDNASSEDAQWMLITKADRLAQLANASEQNPVDATIVIKDASFNKFAAKDSPWTSLNQGWGWNNRNFGDKNTESFNSQAYDLSQTITVPQAGVYEISVQSYYRDGDMGAHATRVVNGESLHAPGVLYAGTQEQPLVYIHEEADRAPGEGTNSDCGNIPDLMDQAACFFQNGLYWNRVRVTVPTDNSSLTIGIKKTGSDYRANDWIVADNFRLTYLGLGNISFDENTTSIEAYDGIATGVTLNRTLKADRWNTFCVPFAMDIEKLGEGAEVRELASVEQSGDHYRVTFSDAESIEAGKPYLVKVPSDMSSIELTSETGITVNTTITPSVTKDGVTFTGVYTNGKAPMGSFIISNNKFYNVDSDVTLKGFRGYITVDSGNSVKALSFDLDDDATGLKDLNDLNDLKEIYNVAGQRMSKVQKGINIINGKKILK